MDSCQQFDRQETTRAWELRLFCALTVPPSTGTIEKPPWEVFKKPRLVVSVCAGTVTADSPRGRVSERESLVLDVRWSLPAHPERSMQLVRTLF